MTDDDVFDLCIPHIQKFEGFVASPYYCPALELTIGYGEVIKPNKLYNQTHGSEVIKLSKPVPEIHQIKKRNAELKNQWGDLITKTQAVEFIKNHLKNDWIKIKNHLPPNLTHNQKIAILSFVYNVGVGAFMDSTMYRLLKKSYIDRAGLEFDRWIFVDGKKSQGLINRRQHEKNIFLSA